MLGELSWKDQSDGRLDFSGGESVFLIISDELGGLGSDLLEDVVDEGVHDGHGSLGDTGLWVNLLQDSVDVDGECLGSLGLSLGNSWLGGGSLLDGRNLSGFWWHYLNYLVLYYKNDPAL